MTLYLCDRGRQGGTTCKFKKNMGELTICATLDACCFKKTEADYTTKINSQLATAKAEFDIVEPVV